MSKEEIDKLVDDPDIRKIDFKGQHLRYLVHGVPKVSLQEIRAHEGVRKAFMVEGKVYITPYTIKGKFNEWGEYEVR